MSENETIVLRCLSNYHSGRHGRITAGNIVHKTGDEGKHLLRDSRESFEVLATTVAGVLDLDGKEIETITQAELVALDIRDGAPVKASADASEKTAMSTEDSPSTAEPDSDVGEPDTGEAQPDEEALTGKDASEPDEEAPGEAAAGTATDEPTADPDEKPSRKSRPRRASANA